MVSPLIALNPLAPECCVFATGVKLSIPQRSDGLRRCAGHLDASAVAVASFQKLKTTHRVYAEAGHTVSADGDLHCVMKNTEGERWVSQRGDHHKVMSRYQ